MIKAISIAETNYPGITKITAEGWDGERLVAELLAHVPLFVSQALQCGAEEQALGGIGVVQTTRSADSLRRLATLATRRPPRR